MTFANSGFAIKALQAINDRVPVPKGYGAVWAGWRGSIMCELFSNWAEQVAYYRLLENKKLTERGLINKFTEGQCLCWLGKNHKGGDE
jgi:hypothetical protein